MTTEEESKKQARLERIRRAAKDQCGTQDGITRGDRMTRDLVHQRKEQRRAKRLGHSSGHYRAVLSVQQDCCAICGVREPAPPGRRFSVDHDHSCCPGEKMCGRCTRGLLCGRCNSGLGFFQDDPERLRTAADYLDAWRLNPRSTR